MFLLTACAPGSGEARQTISTPTPVLVTSTSTATIVPSTESAPQIAVSIPKIRAAFGAPVTFATHAQLLGYGFVVGPSDGQFGAIPTGNRTYTFYGVAGSNSMCTGTPGAKNSTYTFTGTLDHVTGSDCTKLFGPGDGPAGWIFDTNYAGGGQVIRFLSGGQYGWLMPFHGEVWWENPATSDHTCNGIPVVPCFYSSLGLAVSTDNGRTFKVVGQIFQPNLPLTRMMGKGLDLAVGYGSLLVADSSGHHLDNPPVDPSSAYFYLFFTDLSGASAGPCAVTPCIGVARAPYLAVVAAALSGDPHKVATVFHKYDGAAGDPWTQPATSNTPGESSASGTFEPLWTDQPVVSPAVIYDSSFSVYLAAYHSRVGIEVRASNDLIHWSEPIATPYSESGKILYTTSLIGETGDPTIGGPVPRIYFSSFPSSEYPNWKFSIFESVSLMLSGAQ